MKWTSALAIYLLFWAFSAFFVLPFHGRRASDDATPLVRGQEPGAPATFRPGRILLQMTIVATIAFGLYYLAYVNRSEEHTSDLQSLMRISYAVFCLKKKNPTYDTQRDGYPQQAHYTPQPYSQHATY